MFFPTLFTTTTAIIIAASSSSSAAVLPPRAPGESSSNTFRLSVNVTRFDLTPSLQGQEVGYAPTGDDDCLSNLVLASSPGATFYQTGDPTTTVHLADSGAGIVVTPGGTATVPSLNTVQLQCGNASAGVGVAPSSAGTVDLQFGSGGGWMACPLDNVVVLRFRSAGQRTLAGCADVQLLPVCEEAEAEEPQGSVATTCYMGL
ncbi:hypothetical protein F5X96DRAFT_638610 [Biscogniauxia mediterranea]|nr:hypothetical protein F5X96DRAFT_638610 [Biscogniauxia mediterranea]